MERAPLLLLLGLISCVHAPPPPRAVTPPEPPPRLRLPPDGLVLQRTACSGSCPVYTLTLQPHGQVHFEGMEDVAQRGGRDWRIEPLFAKHLFGELERAGFLALAARYPTEVEEFPGLVLTFTRAGVTHRVQLGGEGTGALPRDVKAERLLERLATTIDKLTGAARYVETDSKKKAGGCVE